MPKFAHIADCHLGAWRDLRLRELNMKAFQTALDKCLEENVDFIILAGDLFHVNIPNLDTVKRTVEKLKEVRDAGVKIYAIYGSHDYSPNTVSMVDILSSAGLFQKVVEGEVVEDRLVLKFFQDAETGAKIVGLSGRSGALERKYFDILDTKNLQKEPGFKIFVFHSAISELKPVAMAFLQGVPLSNLPKAFNYYAGGHIHKRIEEAVEGYGLIAYPGPLFGANFTDLEETAKGERRGFYIVDFEEEVKHIRFIETGVGEVVYEEIDGEKKTAKQVEKELFDLIDAVDAYQKIVLLRVRGVMSAGKVADINFAKARDMLVAKGATYVFLNRRALTTEEAVPSGVIGESPEEIERRLLKERIGSFKVDPTLDKRVQRVLKRNIASDAGISLARSLLSALKAEPLEGEKMRRFEARVLAEALKLLPMEAVK